MAHLHAQLVSEDAKRAFMERSKSLLTNESNPRKWWCTVKTAVLGTSSSLPPLVDRGGKLVWSADEKAHCFWCTSMLSSAEIVFSSRILVALFPYCVLLPPVFIRNLLLDLDPYGGNGSDGMLPLFCKEVARELAPKFAEIFRYLVNEGSFPAHWK